MFQVAELEAQLGHPAASQPDKEELSRSLEELEALLRAKDQAKKTKKLDLSCTACCPHLFAISLMGLKSSKLAQNTILHMMHRCNLVGFMSLTLTGRVSSSWTVTTNIWQICDGKLRVRLCTLSVNHP